MLCSARADSVGHIPSGLFIVASSNGQLIDGYLASWIQQVSFDPLLISIAIKPGRPAYDLIKSGQAFGVNVVGEHDKSFLKHFWKGYDPNFNPFAELGHELGPYGGVLLHQARSVLECKMIGSAQPGDHEVIFAEVLASHLMNEDSKSIVHLRKSGASY